MEESAKAVQDALATVQRALDSLTARGQHEAAYEVARAQFAASMRASWPANLAGLASSLDHVVADRATALSDDEREELRRAADVLRAVPHP